MKFYSRRYPNRMLCVDCLDVIPTGADLVVIENPMDKRWRYLKLCTHRSSFRVRRIRKAPK